MKKSFAFKTSNFLSSMVFLLATFLFIYPEVSVFFGILIFLSTTKQHKVLFFDKELLLVKSAFFLLLSLKSFNDRDPKYLLYFIFPFITQNLYNLFYAKRQYLLLGCILSLFALFGYQFYIFNYSNNDWTGDNNTATAVQLVGYTKIIPRSDVNAIVIKQIGFQGGTYKFRFSIRSSISQIVNFSFNRSDLPEFRKNYSCKVSINWSTCEFLIHTYRLLPTFVSIGGYDSWSSKLGIIEIKDEEIIQIKSLSIVTFFRDFRIQSFIFNLNALAAIFVVFGMILLLFSSNIALSYAVSSVAILGIFFTGSRNAMISAVFACTVYFLAKRGNLLRANLFIFVVYIALLFQLIISSTVNTKYVTSDPLIARSIQIFDTGSIRERLAIWRLGVAVWLDNPSSILLGTINYNSVMQARFESDYKELQLDIKTITHSHNLWIQTTGESGISGLLLLLYIWLYAFKKAYKILDLEALTLLSAILMINNFDYLFYYAPIHLMFWTVINKISSYSR